MRKTKLRLLLLAALLTGTALLSTARPATAQCIPDLCWIVDANTTCCWLDDCTLWCG